MQKPLSIGVDIGGSHITCAVVQMHEGKMLGETLSRATYDHTAPAELIFDRWAGALNSSLSEIDASQLAGIGFAMPGPFDYRNGVSKMQHKFPHLYEVHIPTVLQPLLSLPPGLPMRFLNDASAFAVGEAWLGEGKGYEKVVVITLGTGFGSAFIAGGVPVVSDDSVPKEGCLWHLPFLDGIADDYFSTRWFIGEYQKQTGQQVSGVKELMDKAESDTQVRALFSQFGANLAACIAAPLRRFGTEILIIGGNIAHALPLFGDAFQEGLKRENVSVNIAVSRLFETAALLGSARLLEDAFWEKVSEELPNV